MQLGPLKQLRDTAKSAGNLDEITKVGSRMAFGVVDLAGFLDDTSLQAAKQRDQIDQLRAQGNQIDEACTSASDAHAALDTTGKEIAKMLIDSTQAVLDTNKQAEEIAVWVSSVNERMAKIEDTLNKVERLNSEISSIARQVNILAINAKIEAVRAGASGRGFTVVAEAITELSRSTSLAAEAVTVGITDLGADFRKLGTESRSVSEDASGVIASFENANSQMAEMGRVMKSTAESAHTVTERFGTIATSVNGFFDILDTLEKTTHATDEGMKNAHKRSHDLVDASESVVKLGIACGGVSEDQKFIDFVTEAAHSVGKTFEANVDKGKITLMDLFDTDYKPVPGTNPEQSTTRYTLFTDSVLPRIQEPALGLDPKIVFCAAVDKNGYLPTHNIKFSRQQGKDPVWNMANSRNRRIFDDRVGLKAGQNVDPFLLQIYRRDMGGGNFRVMKDLSAPIFVNGRHWGGLRLAYNI